MVGHFSLLVMAKWMKHFCDLLVAVGWLEAFVDSFLDYERSSIQR